MLRDENLWDKPKVIRSAPGAGKTTMFRLFTARSLLTIYSLRKMEYCIKLFQNLKALGAMNENGPAVLGVMLSCARNYATLEDLDIDPVKKRRLLLSLLNARIILAALQGILTLKGLKYPLDGEEEPSSYSTSKHSRPPSPPASRRACSPEHMRGSNPRPKMNRTSLFFSARWPSQNSLKNEFR